MKQSLCHVVPKVGRGSWWSTNPGEPWQGNRLFRWITSTWTRTNITVHVFAKKGNACRTTGRGSIPPPSSGWGRGEEASRQALQGKSYRQRVAPQPVILDRLKRGLLPKWATNLISHSHLIIPVHPNVATSVAFWVWRASKITLSCWQLKNRCSLELSNPLCLFSSHSAALPLEDVTLVCPTLTLKTVLRQIPLIFSRLVAWLWMAMWACQVVECPFFLSINPRWKP